MGGMAKEEGQKVKELRTIGKQNCEAQDWTHGFLQVDEAFI